MMFWRQVRNDWFLLIGASLILLAGGSAKAAGDLVAKLGGKTLEYLFIVEVSFLKGASNLNAPVYSVTQIDE
jgi:adenine phosphoribosyltransferase